MDPTDGVRVNSMKSKIELSDEEIKSLSLLFGNRIRFRRGEINVDSVTGVMKILTNHGIGDDERNVTFRAGELHSLRKILMEETESTRWNEERKQMFLEIEAEVARFQEEIDG